MIDIDECIERLYRCGMLTEQEVKEVCDKVKELLIQESNVQQLQAPVTVVGDVHGQFFDLLEIFNVAGRCPDTNYLFLGDYVDRGHHSVETISLLACLQVKWPKRITLLRGNHESRQITQVYGFYAECLRKYGNANVWKYFTDMFDYLTISAVISDDVFAIHGGLSPSIQTLDQIKVLDRFQEVPHEGPLADLMWSDPENDRQGFQQSQRGAGYVFGKDMVERFLQITNLNHIVRAHQLCMEGYSVLFDNKLSTVWSAPNYCYRCGNVASVMEIYQNNTRNFNVFSAAPESERQKPAIEGAREVPEYFM
eukprot:TRINITY_DN2821_c0_g3_i2.p1 TRINITY_DN2821_c0_g3~~TRINITY_DN2821_c0_g3_i2.p1  ORF type:complete len:309 (-),score=54.49 TRINITY_DN2821_c0_g3_i2:394-1320(-)